MAEIVAKIRYSAKSDLLNKEAGFYWWFSALAPDGADLVGVVKGPYAKATDARDSIDKDYPDTRVIYLPNKGPLNAEATKAFNNAG